MNNSEFIELNDLTDNYCSELLIKFMSGEEAKQFNKTVNIVSSVEEEIENPLIDDLIGNESGISNIKICQTDKRHSIKLEFPPIFQKILEETRNEMGLEDRDRSIKLKYKIEDVNDKGDISEEDEDFKNCVNEMLNRSGLDVWKARKELEMKALRDKNKDSVQIILPQKLSPKNLAEYDSMSGIWRLLDGDSIPDGFPITEETYNLLKDDRAKWLIRPDLKRDERESSRIKCENWMKKSIQKK